MIDLLNILCIDSACYSACTIRPKRNIFLDYFSHFWYILCFLDYFSYFQLTPFLARSPTDCVDTKAQDGLRSSVISLWRYSTQTDKLLERQGNPSTSMDKGCFVFLAARFFSTITPENPSALQAQLTQDYLPHFLLPCIQKQHSGIMDCKNISKPKGSSPLKKNKIL